MSSKILVIGAGVIGAASALSLQADGHHVTLLDRESPCAGTSFGNAGEIVNGSCVPTAMPGILYDIMRMAAQPLPHYLYVQSMSTNYSPCYCVLYGRVAP